MDQVAEGVVVVGVGDRASGVGERADAAVAVVIVIKSLIDRAVVLQLVTAFVD
jgi:hypothetical protein